MSSVLFVSLMNGASWGGSEEIWFQTALYAAGTGRKVGCALYPWPGKESKIQRLADAGCQIFLLPNKGRQKRNILERIQNKITKKITVRRFIKNLPVDQYDAVVVNQGYFEVITNVWKDFYKQLPKYALIYHNYQEKERFKAEKARILENWVQHAHINLFASARIKQILEGWFKHPIDNGDILLNPITFQPPADYTPYPPLQNGHLVFVMLAALDVRRKAQDNLIKVLSTVKWKERNWVLHLYGDGIDKTKLAQMIQENAMQEKITLKGHVNDVKSVLQNTHVLFQVTNIDAMPLAVVEAMAMSRPVIASRIGDMPYWVDHNKTGWICENSSPEEIDRVLEIAWSRKDEWNEMGKRSFDVFKKKFADAPEERLLKQLGV
jgi:glycosyltransferase involved in cell wall biosynthesis